MDKFQPTLDVQLEEIVEEEDVNNDPVLEPVVLAVIPVVLPQRQYLPRACKSRPPSCSRRCQVGRPPGRPQRRCAAKPEGFYRV